MPGRKKTIAIADIKQRLQREIDRLKAINDSHSRKKARFLSGYLAVCNARIAGKKTITAAEDPDCPNWPLVCAEECGDMEAGY